MRVGRRVELQAIHTPRPKRGRLLRVVGRLRWAEHRFAAPGEVCAVLRRGKGSVCVEADLGSWLGRVEIGIRARRP